MFYEVRLDEEHLNQYKTFECCSNSKVDANFFFKDGSCQGSSSTCHNDVTAAHTQEIIHLTVS